MSQPDPKLLEILVCPVTKGLLIYDREKQELVSQQAGLAFLAAFVWLVAKTVSTGQQLSALHELVARLSTEVNRLQERLVRLETAKPWPPTFPPPAASGWWTGRDPPIC